MGVPAQEPSAWQVSPPVQASPSSQARPSLMPCAWHAPPAQTPRVHGVSNSPQTGQLVPAGQQVPRPVAGSAPHGALPSAQTQSPLRQSWPPPHWKPHAPQLKSSVPATTVQ
jgi:hypothetical protein